MSKDRRSTTGARTQVDQVRSVYIDPKIAARVKQYADANAVSESEVYRDAIDHVLGGQVPVGRSRATVRKTIWVDFDRYSRFIKKVKADGTTNGQAIERALEDIL